MSTPEPLRCQRALFSLPAGQRYLNCAYMSPLSRRVQGAGAAGIRREAEPWSIAARDFFDGCDEVRRLFARLVGSDEPERVAVVPAASYGLATVARNTTLEPGQNVVTVHEQFPSNVHVWRRLCAESGAELRAVGAPAGTRDRAEAWNEALLLAIDARTALVAIGTVDWADGTRFDLERIGARAREVGAAFVIDGAQSVGVDPIDVAFLRPDALVCPGYKWLTGPYSIGVTWLGSRYDAGRPLEETWAARVGSDDFASLVSPSDAYRPGAARYDVGEAPSFVLVPMLVAALEQVLEWEVSRIRAYSVELARATLSDARLGRVGIASDSERASHIFGLRLPPEVDPKRVQAGLAERGVHVSVRGRVIRVSPHVYNDRGDVDALLEGLVGVLA